MRTYLLNAAAGREAGLLVRLRHGRRCPGGGTLGNTLLTDPTDRAAGTLTPAGRAFPRIRSWMAGTLVGTPDKAPCAADRKGTYTCLVAVQEGRRPHLLEPAEDGEGDAGEVGDLEGRPSSGRPPGQGRDQAQGRTTGRCWCGPHASRGPRVTYPGLRIDLGGLEMSRTAVRRGVLCALAWLAVVAGTAAPGVGEPTSASPTRSSVCTTGPAASYAAVHEGSVRLWDVGVRWQRGRDRAAATTLDPPRPAGRQRPGRARPGDDGGGETPSFYAADPTKPPRDRARTRTSSAR